MSLQDIDRKTWESLTRPGESIEQIGNIWQHLCSSAENYGTESAHSSEVEKISTRRWRALGSLAKGICSVVTFNRSRDLRYLDIPREIGAQTCKKASYLCGFFKSCGAKSGRRVGCRGNQ